MLEYGVGVLGLIAFVGGLWVYRGLIRTRLTLERRVAELATLNHIGQAITANLSLDDLLEAIYIQVQKLCQVSTFYIALYDHEQHQVSFPYVMQQDQPLSWPSRKLDQGLTEYIISIRQPLLLPNRVAERLTALGVEGKGAIPACYLGVPMIVRDEVLGVLALQHGEHEHAYNEQDCKLLMTVAAQAAVALRNARLFEEAQAASTELHTLVETSRLFAATLDLNHVARTIVEQVANATSAQHVTLYEWLTNHNALRVLAHNPPETAAFAKRLLADQSNVLHNVVITGQAVTLCDAFSGEANAPAEAQVIPLSVHDQSLGLLVLWDAGVPPHPHDVLEGLIHQATTAMQNAIIFSLTDASLRDRVIELSTIEVVSRQMAATLDLETAISDVLAAVMSAIDATIGHCVLEVEPGRFALVARLDASGAQLDVPFIDNIQGGVVGRVLKTRQPMILADVQEDPDYVCLTPDTRSELCVPIMFEGRLVGALDFENSHLNAFTESNARLVTMLAEHLAIAVENTRLFNDRRRQIETLVSLHTLSLRLLSALDFDSVVAAVMDGAQHITHAQAIFLYLRQPTNGQLSCVARRGQGLPSNPNVYCQQVAQSGESYYSASVRTMPVYPAFTYKDFTARACIPLQRTGQILGVLEVVFGDPHYYTQNEIQALEVLANQAAVAIENTQLVDEIRAGRDQMQAILDSTREGMLLFDARGRLLRFNPAAEDLLNQQLTPFVGQSFLRWLRTVGAPELQSQTGYNVKQLRQYIADVLRFPTRITHRQFEHRMGDDVRYIDETGLPVLDQQGDAAGWLLVWRDVTEERKVDNLRQELSSMIVHDLRNPITSVISSLTMMQEFLLTGEADTEVFTDVIEIAHSSSESMLNLVESLLDISRLEQGRVKLNCQELILGELIDTASMTMFSLLASTDIALQIDVSDDLPRIWGDAEKIRRVFINLLDNALRHTPVAGEIRIEAGLCPDEQEMLVRVVDTGPGIPPESREHIFDKFAQLECGPMRGHKGSGLGLTFCKLAIETHGGRIWIDEGPEGGAAFCFTLPLVPADSAVSDPSF